MCIGKILQKISFANRLKVFTCVNLFSQSSMVHSNSISYAKDMKFQKKCPINSKIKFVINLNSFYYLVTMLKMSKN